MLRRFRVPQLVAAAFVLIAPALPAHGQENRALPQSGAQAGAPVHVQLQVTEPHVPPEQRDTPWLYRGSDIPQDPLWTFGTLPNGVRYAVRRNGVPPGQVSIRVRVDAGSLMERDSERGFAHLLEHLTFRESQYVGDGESRRIWQRMGVTFGSDSNASTTFTQTVYQLDLPDATEAGLNASLTILSGMIANPTITAATLDAERPVVLAEQREQPGARVRMDEAMLRLMFAGQPLAERNPIGTVETLTHATPAAVRAFHQRWYRPERVVVVVVGDADPAMLVRLITAHFAAWRGQGAAVATPGFGAPATGAPTGATVEEPSLPPIISMSVARPWTVFLDTIRFNQERMVDLVAARILNRRLETRARGGASFLAAGVALDDVARSANVTSVQILPVGDNWEGALHDVRAILADAAVTPPTQAEIDREVAEIDNAMRNGIATERVEPMASIADNLVSAIDINETTTNAEGSYSIFRGAVDGGMFTPDAVQAASARLFSGGSLRAIVNTRTPDPDALARLNTALTTPVEASGRNASVDNVSIDQLPALGRPGRVTGRRVVLEQPRVEQVTFANGVRLLMHQTSAETHKVYVRVRFGRGLNALPTDHRVPVWAGEMALMPSGLGGMGQEQLDALTGRRQLGLEFSVDDDAFLFGAQTTREDLADQLRLFATKLAAPDWDPNPVLRARAAMLTSYDSMSVSPDAVLARDLDNLLHGGDPRWGIPTRAQIEALTPESFRAFWEPMLAAGPIEVQVFGDMDSNETVAAVAATFGALRARPVDTTPPPPVRFPAHVDTPVVRTHNGQADQAAAVIAWPTGGGSAGITEARKVDILAAVFRDRLLEQLRSQAGVSYSPNVVSNWPVGLPSGGAVLAVGLVPPDKTDFFFMLARSIAADLVANPISADELRRALVPLVQSLSRQSSGNLFWMQQVDGGTVDPARIAAVNTLAQDVVRTTPEELQAMARKYLNPARDWTMVVLPEQGAQAPAPRTGADVGR